MSYNLIVTDGEKLRALLTWAEDAKELGVSRVVREKLAALSVHIRNLRQAASDDRDRYLSYYESTQDLLKTWAELSAKLVKMYPIWEGVQMTDKEICLYTSARLNMLLAPLMGKSMPDAIDLYALTEPAWDEAWSLGARPELVEAMQKNFWSSLKILPPASNPAK